MPEPIIDLLEAIQLDEDHMQHHRPCRFGGSMVLPVQTEKDAKRTTGRCLGPGHATPGDPGHQNMVDLQNGRESRHQDVEEFGGPTLAEALRQLTKGVFSSHP